MQMSHLPYTVLYVQYTLSLFTLYSLSALLRKPDCRYLVDSIDVHHAETEPCPALLPVSNNDRVPDAFASLSNVDVRGLRDDVQGLHVHHAHRLNAGPEEVPVLAIVREKSVFDRETETAPTTYSEIFLQVDALAASACAESKFTSTTIPWLPSPPVLINPSLEGQPSEALHLGSERKVAFESSRPR